MCNVKPGETQPVLLISRNLREQATQGQTDEGVHGIIETQRHNEMYPHHPVRSPELEPRDHEGDRQEGSRVQNTLSPRSRDGELGVVLKDGEERIVDGVPDEEEELGEVEPRLLDVVAVEEDLDVVEVEGVVNHGHTQTGGAVRQHASVQRRRGHVG